MQANHTIVVEAKGAFDLETIYLYTTKENLYPSKMQLLPMRNNMIKLELMMPKGS